MLRSRGPEFGSCPSEFGHVGHGNGCGDFALWQHDPGERAKRRRTELAPFHRILTVLTAYLGQERRYMRPSGTAGEIVGRDAKHPGVEQFVPFDGEAGALPLMGRFK